MLLVMGTWRTWTWSMGFNHKVPAVINSNAMIPGVRRGVPGCSLCLHDAAPAVHPPCGVSGGQDAQVWHGPVSGQGHRLTPRQGGHMDRRGPDGLHLPDDPVKVLLGGIGALLQGRNLVLVATLGAGLGHDVFGVLHQLLYQAL